MHTELLDYVDEQDNILWIKERHEIYSERLPYRVCHVIVVNSQWEIALQKRSQKVRFMPGAWSTSAGWHVSSGDTYETSALRELQEEIGISWKLKFLDKAIFTNPENDHFKFMWIFTLEYNWSFSYIDGEVESVEFQSIKTIKTMVQQWQSFHPELLHILKNYYF